MYGSDDIKSVARCFGFRDKTFDSCYGRSVGNAVGYKIVADLLNVFKLLNLTVNLLYGT